MKVHFIGAVEGDKNCYKKITLYLEEFGFELITSHSITRTIEDINQESEEESTLYTRRMYDWIKQADIVLVEATKSVFGAGFEIAVSLQLGKPVIVLFQPRDDNQPHVLKGVSSDRLQVIDYNEETLKEVLKLSLDYAAEQRNVRFTFFIPPDIQQYLNWITKTTKRSRAEYIRGFIEEEMKKNKKWEGKVK